MCLCVCGLETALGLGIGVYGFLSRSEFWFAETSVLFVVNAFVVNERSIYGTEREQDKNAGKCSLACFAS